MLKNGKLEVGKSPSVIDGLKSAAYKSGEVVSNDAEVRDIAELQLDESKTNLPTCHTTRAMDGEATDC